MRYLSLFSGIEACSAAWKPLGWTCVAVAEIEPFPAAVLAHHYPSVPNLGDVTAITDARIAALGPIDLVVGGSPCQDLSVAGKRAGLAGERSSLFHEQAGLAGERSSLFHEQVRIFHAARALCGARFLLWENVPGAFSSHGGRDFGIVVGSMAGCELGVPRGGWGTCGAAIGSHGLVEWRVLDAQYVRVESHPRAVPQRRRRVFALLDSGAWRDRPPILLEPEGLRGHPAPRREAGQGSAAKSLCRSDGGIDREDRHTLIAHSLRADGFDASEDGTGGGVPMVPTAFGGNDTRGAINVATAVNAHGGPYGRLDFESETFIATPVAPIPFDTTQITSAGNYSRHQPGDPAHPLAAGAHAPAIAFHNRQDPDVSGAVTHPLGAKDNGLAVGVDCFNGQITGSVAATMGTPGSSVNASGPPVMAVAPSITATNDPSRSPQSAEVTQQVLAVHAAAMQVRRLTPRECERLMGLPDDYTLVPVRGKPAADGPRYRALGNSMAVNCMRWIGERIDAAAGRAS